MTDVMTDEDLLSLLRQGESDRVEFKAALSDDDVPKAICAFANDLPGHRKPGVLFVGIRDDGTSSQITITDSLIERLAGIRSTGRILPIPSLVVQKRALHGSEVAVVLVEPADAPPVRYKGVAWVRSGSTTVRASAQEERILSERARFRHEVWDLAPIRSANLDDIDLALFERVYLPSAVSPEVLEENERPLELQLRSLRLWDAEAGRPTVLGLLVCGRDPERFLPGAWLQFLRLDGAGLTDPILDQQRLSGPLPDLMRQLDELLRLNIRTKTDIVSSDREIRQPDYPLEALQQITRNALMHREYQTSNAPVRIHWFADRVEVSNPGGPFGLVTRQNFESRQYTSYRNPNLAAAMRNLGYVQQFGIGIRTADRALAQNGNPPLEFEVDTDFVLARLRAR